MRRSLAALVVGAALLSGCAELESKPKLAPPIRINEDPYPSTYVRYPGVPTVIRHATVFVDTPEGSERDDDLLAALDDHRVRLQGAVGRQARLKRTPTLAFRPDEVERSAARVDDVLRHLEHPDA